MKTTRLIYISTIIALLIAMIYFFFGNFKTEKNHGSYIFQFDDIDVIFDQDGRTAKELSKERTCKIITNGSYFGYTDRSKEAFTPVGIRNDATFTGTTLTDPNLQEILHISQNKIQHIPGTDSSMCGTGTCFSAGPLLIQNNIINIYIEGDTSHRKENYQRTALVQSNERNYIVISTKRISLGALTQSIIDQIRGDITFAINLDGGPSTSFMDTEKNINYNINTKLPKRLCLDSGTTPI